MNKTPQQVKFENLITGIITINACVVERKCLLEDFLEDCDIYYDFFCDRIYDFFEEKGKGIIVVDERGFVHINPKNKAEHRYFTILSESDYLEESTDVIDYINLGLTHLEEQLLKVY